MNTFLTTAENPYTNRPVTTKEYFNPAFGGRGIQARRILRSICRSSPLPDSISIVGERRFGKTSLLGYLFAEAANTPHLLILSMDMSSLKSRHPEAFYDMLTRNLVNAGALVESTQTLDNTTFRSFLGELARFKKHLVLLIDEFDKVAQDQHFGETFFDNLRSAATTLPLTLVVASITPLIKVAHAEITSSPFFNIFQEERLKPLSIREVEALICDPPNGAQGVKEYSDVIIRLAGHHPFFLQQACSSAWELREDQGNDFSIETMQAFFMERVHNHYQYIWNICADDERNMLIQLANGAQPQKYELETLIERGYVLDETIMRIFGEGFVHFIKMHCYSRNQVIPYHLEKIAANEPSPKISEYWRDGVKNLTHQQQNTPTEKEQFDVFFCYNDEDRLVVKEVAETLKKFSVRPWLAERELRPGHPSQPLIEKQIQQIPSAAVFIGPKGLGPWHKQEMYALLHEFVKRSCPVIPVLLSGSLDVPQLPPFLAMMTWVDFRIKDPDPIQQLIKGIKGLAYS